ncbi:hypothetical protein F-liban_3 [Faustovirus]|nr:hypothetical protein F-liban_3 [Faustovirus]SME64667.1 Hypothetical protein FSTVST1_2 [Faustovirus ST1]
MAYLVIPKDIIEYHIIKHSPEAFLGVAKWTKVRAVVELWRLGSELGHSMILGDNRCMGIIRCLRINGLDTNIKLFTGLLGHDETDRRKWLRAYINSIDSSYVWRLWDLVDYYDRCLWGVVICWALT